MPPTKRNAKPASKKPGIVRHGNIHREWLASAFETHEHNLLAYAKRVLIPHEAADAVQQVFLRAAKDPAISAKVDNIGGYFFRALQNECRNRLLEKKRRQVIELNGNSEHLVVSRRGASPAEQASYRNTQEKLLKVVKTWPESLQLVGWHLVNTGENELPSMQALANQMGVTLSTAKWRVGKARRLLQEALTEQSRRVA